VTIAVRTRLIEQLHAHARVKQIVKTKLEGRVTRETHARARPRRNFTVTVDAPRWKQKERRLSGPMKLGPQRNGVGVSSIATLGIDTADV
jgi:hypothetical protein